MPLPYCYEYPRPAVTVDLVVFSLRAGELRVLLIRRKHDPFAGRWAIPGGFVEIDEPIEVAARRELQEETGMRLTSTPIEFLGVFGAPGRDPRGRTISLVHVVALRGPFPRVAGGDDAAQAAWVGIGEATGLAFDHDLILARALAWLDHGVRQGNTGLNLLPRTFRQPQVVELFQALGKPERSALGWLRRMERGGRIVRTEPGGRGERFRTVSD